MNPLTWENLDAWARRTHRVPNALELDALFQLDLVMLFPGEPGEADEAA